MNSLLDRLQPYPFERLRSLLKGASPAGDYAPISMSIGEPKHPAPECVRAVWSQAFDGLSTYPATVGRPALRSAIARWLTTRYGLSGIDPERQILPVNGSKEALFSIAQCVIDRSLTQPPPVVLLPNPGYQVYEGAALMAGAEPFYVPHAESTGFLPDWNHVPGPVWNRVQLVYVCSPGNPAGGVLDLEHWRALFDLSDRHGFVIAADECYSEIYPDDEAPPQGALQAADVLGRSDFSRLIVFSSLSKRSSLPGLRSGFVAGDAGLIARFALLRSYSGGAMSGAVQSTSIVAWQDEAHVVQNRAMYRAKFGAVMPRLAQCLRITPPQGGFFLWAGVPNGDDLGFTRALFEHYNVLVLPGSFLARSVDGSNPGAGFVRIALVDDLVACTEATDRILAFLSPP